MAASGFAPGRLEVAVRFTEDSLPLPALAAPPAFTPDEVRALGEGRALVRDGVLPAERVEAIHAAAQRLWAAGLLRPAGVGRSGTQDPAIRSDRITWIEADGGGEAALAELWAWMDLLREVLVAATWVSLPRFAVQLACYPGEGAHYARHIDALPGDPNRVISVLLYLNRDWTPDQGGMLRIWEPDGVREITPLAGRMVVFRSESLPHAVLPTHAVRWSIAGWMRGSEPLPLLADPVRDTTPRLGQP